MADWLEALERLARLHESGALSDEEFAAEKKRILESQHAAAASSAGLAAADAEPPVQPSQGGAALLWLKRNRWVAGGLVAALALGTLLAFSTIALIERPAEPDGKQEAKGKSRTARSNGPAWSNVDLGALLRFDDAASCDYDDALKAVIDSLAARQPAGPGAAPAAPFDLPGFADPVVPKVERAAAQGSRSGPVVAELLVAGLWHGLRVRALRTVTWRGSQASSVQIRFAEDAAQVRRVLNEQGFGLPAVGELRNADLSGGQRLAIGVEDVAGESALTCAKG